ncbi:hypothetical protein JAAARDRAFT_33420 [Jaapia argillacea MUCL 33604]|uniref:AIG1-type G domain-containing protein n=1 Tax=Jaapia argillacea MUCL 33604 TaxID=933084 RepID=A0A067Q144_9AGAM|nr:hypothetical protein JAAARDRAFT_33420 [Jaapia argillacea MUCL 33604]
MLSNTPPPLFEDSDLDFCVSSSQGPYPSYPGSKYNDSLLEPVSSFAPHTSLLSPLPPPFSSEETLVPIPYTPPNSSGSKGEFLPIIPSANIIVFGQTGAGKSSVINMVAGRNVADSSSDATGCTFKSQNYVVPTPHVKLNLFDTGGLNEGSEGTVQSTDAIKNLYKLVRSMEDGVNLLIYVVKGPRIKESTSNNYRMFFEAFCQKKVPIVLVLTGFENEYDPDDWWRKNSITFHNYGMEFSGQACVTATRGKLNDRGRYVFQKEYDESVPKVVDLITTHYSTEPFRMERIGRFLAVLKTTFNGVAVVLPRVKPVLLTRALYLALWQVGGMSEEQATKLANQIEIELLFAAEDSGEQDGKLVAEGGWFGGLGGETARTFISPPLCCLPELRRSFQPPKHCPVQCSIKIQFALQLQWERFWDWSIRPDNYCAKLSEVYWYKEFKAPGHEYIVLKFAFPDSSAWVRLERDSTSWLSIFGQQEDTARRNCKDKLTVRDGLSELIKPNDRIMASISISLAHRDSGFINFLHLALLQRKLNEKAPVYDLITFNCWWYAGCVWENVAYWLRQSGTEATFKLYAGVHDDEVVNEMVQAHPGATLRPLDWEATIFPRKLLLAHVTTARRVFPGRKSGKKLDDVYKASEEIRGYCAKELHEIARRLMEGSTTTS